MTKKTKKHKEMVLFSLYDRGVINEIALITGLKKLGLYG